MSSHGGEASTSSNRRSAPADQAGDRVHDRRAPRRMGKTLPGESASPHQPIPPGLWESALELEPPSSDSAAALETVVNTVYGLPSSPPHLPFLEVVTEIQLTDDVVATEDQTGTETGIGEGTGEGFGQRTAGTEEQKRQAGGQGSEAVRVGLRQPPGADPSQLQQWARQWVASCGQPQLRVHGELIGGSAGAWQKYFEQAETRQLQQLGQVIDDVEIVLIAGSRKNRRLDLVRGAIDQLPENTIIISGAGGETDKTAASWCRRMQRPVCEFPAEWDKYPDRSAGVIRNSQMVAIASRVIAFWDGSSRGTADTIRKARAAGKPLSVVRVP